MQDGSIFAPSARTQRSPGFVACPELGCDWWCHVTLSPGMTIEEQHTKAELELTAHLHSAHKITTIKEETQ